MIIRKAIKKDIKPISKIFKEEFNKKPYTQNWNDHSASEVIKKYFDKMDIYVYDVNGKIIGFIVSYTNLSKNSKKGVVEELVVRGDNQSKGIGSNLISFIEDLYKKKGIKNMELLSNINSKGFDFYKKRGYMKSKFVLLEKALK